MPAYLVRDDTEQMRSVRLVRSVRQHPPVTSLGLAQAARWCSRPTDKRSASPGGMTIVLPDFTEGGLGCSPIRTTDGKPLRHETLTGDFITAK
jgi:hypothetical protein